MFLHILMVLAEYEREITINRIEDGLKRARKQGKTLGRPKGSKDKKTRSKASFYKGWLTRKEGLKTR